MRVLVATDGSTDARTAAQWLADFPRPDDASALVLAVVDLPPSPLDIPTVADFKRTLLDVRAAVSLITEDRRRALEASLDEAAKRFVAPTHELPVGPPAETLVRLSAEVDLIVVGARGLGALKRLLLGSVSERVLRHAACPVLIVHARAAV
jgi:nucleotide-binding universal stress UspA family protein